MTLKRTLFKSNTVTSAKHTHFKNNAITTVIRKTWKNGAWDSDATFTSVYSGSHHPLANDMTATGSSGIVSSWYKFEVPGTPIGVRVHIRQRYRATDSIRPNFKAMVGAGSNLIDTAAHSWWPAAGNVVSETSWKKATWGGADSVYAAICNETGVTTIANIAGEVVSDLIPISNVITQANGNSYFVMCVEQTVASAPYLQWGAYLARNYLTPLASKDGAENGTYWSDIYMNGVASVLGVTNAPLTGPTAVPSTSTGGQAICAWLEPVYATPIRSFLSSGDSTHSCAYAYDNYAGWIGNAVRSLNDPLNSKIVTYKHSGGSGHSLPEFMNIFEQEYADCSYSDIILQGWSQNGFSGADSGTTNTPVWIARITAAVNAAVAAGKRVFLTTGYGVNGYTTTTNTNRQACITAIKALCDGVKVFLVDTDNLITDYSGGTLVSQPIKSAYNSGDNIHANIAGQNAMRDLLKSVISSTM